MIPRFMLVLNDASSVKNQIQSCVGDICRWMNRNDLKLNEHITEIVLIPLKFLYGPSLNYVNIVGNERIPFSDKATSLTMGQLVVHNLLYGPKF